MLAGKAKAALLAHNELEAQRPDRAEYSQARFHAQGAKPGVGDRRDLRHTGEGWLYLAVMLDLFSRRVVGWTASATHDPALALSALERALAARKPAPGLVHHSDRGAPYASAVYRQKLLAHGLVPRMSRSGDCWDNAVAESFFSFAQGRAGSSRALPDSCCRSCVDRRLHQQFLQPAPPALASQLSQPCRVRITSTNHRPCRMVQVSTESGELHS